MKRWKLWASVASGLLSIGSGSTYYFWPQSSTAESDQVAAASLEQPAPHAVPPKPIPDTRSDSNFNSTQSRFVAPASFNSPASNETTARGNVGGDAFPAQSTFDAAANNAPPVPASNDFAPQQYAGGASAYRASFSDQEESPVANSSGAETESAADTPATPVQVEEQPEVTTSFSIQNPSTNGQDSPPVDDKGVSKPSAAAAPPITEATPNETPSVLPVPKPLSLRTAVPQASAPDAGTQTAPSPDTNSGSLSRFNNLSRPTAPALRSNQSRDTRQRTGEAPAALPENEPAPPASLIPQRTMGARSAVIAPRATRLVSSEPGERRLEGLQSPSLTVERSAPEEIQVGKPAKFVIRVRNVGQVAAQDVIVSDQIPQGTRFVAASPETSPTADGELAWELGALQPGEEATLTIELLPEAEGEIGSVAEVTFRAQAAVRTIATKPLLKVEHSGPAKVLIGQEIPFQITVSNPGSGVATGVVVEVDVPEGLAHDGGREIMSDRFDLRPNESRKIDLVLKAVQAGPVQSVVRAVGDTNLQAEHRAQLEIVAPQLQIGVVGPTRRFLDRPVKYQIGIDNPGTAPAQEIELVARLPRGLKFIAADKKGQYDQRQHAVLWSLEELPAGEQGVVELTAVPTDIGEQKLHVEARGALALEHQHEHTTLVEDITNLAFTINDENVPIEVGSETTYQIRVANNGTKIARNVRLAVQVPIGLEVIDSDGPTEIQQQAELLVMQPIAELGQREEAVYRITAKGTRAGDHVLRVQLLSDESSTPVTKEEITKVYSDK